MAEFCDMNVEILDWEAIRSCHVDRALVEVGGLS